MRYEYISRVKTAFIILNITFLTSSCVDNKKNKEAISYLRNNYEISLNTTNKIEKDSLEIYYTKDSPSRLKTLDTKLISSLTNYTFLKTTLNTGYIEYLDLEMILALPSNPGDKIIELRSPTFEASSDGFLNIFRDISVATNKDEKVIVDEISNLFKEITYKGDIKNIKTSENNYQSELWHGDLLWRIINFKFQDNRLIDITID